MSRLTDVFLTVAPACLIGLASVVALPAGVNADAAQEEWDEAYQRTKDEWDATVKTINETKTKLEEFRRKYQEYDDFIWDQTRRRDFAQIAEYFGWTQQDAKANWDRVQGYFNDLRNAGSFAKLDGAISALESASGKAAAVTNAWEFAEKFDPRKGQDDPTHGLKLIGNILSEGAAKFEAIPLAGKVLGPWVRAYAEAATDYAAALDRLSKKIQQNTRQGALCGQSGVWLKQQQAFASAASGRFSAENCGAYFLSPAFPRIRSQVYAGQDNYFFYEPGSGRGYFSTNAWTAKVYAWHGLLLSTRRLEADWLASRSNSMTSALEADAREAARRVRGLRAKSDPAWIIAAKLNLEGTLQEYGDLDEETLVANFLLDSSVKGAIGGLLDQIGRYVFASGSVRDRDDDTAIAGAGVTLTVGSRSGSSTTGDGGAWEILLQGTTGEATSLLVEKEGYQPFRDSGGRLPRQAMTDWNVRLAKAARPDTALADTAVVDTTVVRDVGSWMLTGRVVDLNGNGIAAAVVTGGPTQPSTGADGGFAFDEIDVSRQLEAGLFPSLTLSATVQTADGSTAASVAVTVNYDPRGASRVTLTIPVVVPQEVVISGTTQDANGVPLAGVTVSSDRGESTTSGSDGGFRIGPVVLAEGETVTLTPTFRDDSGQTWGGGNVSVAYSGANSIGGVVLAVLVVQETEITVSGRVVDAGGTGVPGATVEAAGLRATTSDGAFTLSGITHTLGEPLTVTASVDVDGAEPASSSARVTPTADLTGGVTIRLPVVVATDTTGVDTTAADTTTVAADTTGAEADTAVTDIDEPGEVPDNLADAADELAGGDSDEAFLAECRAASRRFDAQSGRSRRLVLGFADYRSSFEQRLRTALGFAADGGSSGGRSICDDNLLAYNLSQAARTADEHDLLLDELSEAYAALSICSLDPRVQASGELLAALDFVVAFNQFDEAVNANATMHSDYVAMARELRDVYGCDEDALVRRGEDVAEQGADADDVEAGVKGTDPTVEEICGNGIDDDNDGTKDECPPCCGGSAVIVVEDCGSEPDDAFLVVLDTGASGSTPPGGRTSFTADLDPGQHSFTITVVTAPDDLGTFCVTVTVDGNVVASVEGGPPQGSAQTFTFDVPEPGAPGATAFGKNAPAAPLVIRADPELMREGR